MAAFLNIWNVTFLGTWRWKEAKLYTKDSCLCSREHPEHRSLTNRSIVWHPLQFLHNINVQQLKGQQILQGKHTELPWANSESESHLHLAAQIPLMYTQHFVPQHNLRGSFPPTYFYIIEYGAQIRAARDKAKNTLVRARERLNADSFLRILICPTHSFHIVTVPNTSLRKQLCYIKCNILFLKIERPFLELRSFILTDVCLSRHQTQGGLLYIYLNFSTLPVQWGDQQMGYKILSHLADFWSLKEQLAEVFQPALQFHLSVEHLFLSPGKHPAKTKKPEAP